MNTLSQCVTLIFRAMFCDMNIGNININAYEHVVGDLSNDIL